MNISEWCGPQRGFLGSNGLYHCVILAYRHAATLILFSNWPLGVSVLDIALSATNLPLKVFPDFFHEHVNSPVLREYSICIRGCMVGIQALKLYPSYTNRRHRQNNVLNETEAP